MIVVKPSKNDVSRLALQYFQDRCANKIPGSDLTDWSKAEKDLTKTFEDIRSYTDWLLCDMSMRYWTITESLKWNQIALSTLQNFYFPLLRNDDMKEYGDRVCPSYMFHILLQSNRLAFPKITMTKEEYKDLLDYRNDLKITIEYLIREKAENAVSIRQRLDSRSKDNWTAQDRFDATQIDLDHDMLKIDSYIDRGLIEREPRKGDRLRCVRLPEITDIHGFASTGRVMIPGSGGVGLQTMKIDDEIIVSNYYRSRELNKKSEIGSLFKHEQKSYNMSTSVMELQEGEIRIKIDYFEGVGFKIAKYHFNEDHLPSKDISCEVPRPGMNPLSDTIMRENEFLGFRMQPRHLAEIIGLRYLDYLSGNDVRTVLERMWEDWCSFSTTHYVDCLFRNRVHDNEAMEVIRSIIEQYPKAVSDYKSGKENALGFLIGQVRKSLGKERLDVSFVKTSIIKEISA